MENENRHEGHSQRVDFLESDRQEQVIVNREVGRIQNKEDVDMDHGSGSYITCPVCGGRISADQLPDKESVVDDGMFYMIETDRIVNSRVTIEHTFDHFFNEEEDCVRNDPHTLGSIIEAEFDGTGECIAFSVLKIYAAPGDQE